MLDAVPVAINAHQLDETQSVFSSRRLDAGMFAGVDIPSVFRERAVEVVKHGIPSLDFGTMLEDPNCSDHRLPEEIAFLNRLWEGPAVKMKIEKLVQTGVLVPEEGTKNLILNRVISCDSGKPNIVEKFIIRPRFDAYFIVLEDGQREEYQTPYEVELYLERTDTERNLTETYKHFGIVIDDMASTYGRTDPEDRLGQFLRTSIKQSSFDEASGVETVLRYEFDWSHDRKYNVQRSEIIRHPNGALKHLEERHYAPVDQPDLSRESEDLSDQKIDRIRTFTYDDDGHVIQQTITYFESEGEKEITTNFVPGTEYIRDSHEVWNGQKVYEQQNTFDSAGRFIRSDEYYYRPDENMWEQIQINYGVNEVGESIRESTLVRMGTSLTVPKLDEDQYIDLAQTNTAVYIYPEQIFEVEPGTKAPDFILVQNYNVQPDRVGRLEDQMKIPFPEGWHQVRVENLRQVWDQEQCGYAQTMTVSNPVTGESINHEFFLLHHSPERACPGSTVLTP